MTQAAFVRPVSLEDALRLLGQGSAARVIAGGQSLVPTFRCEGTRPEEVLVGIDQLSALKGISSVDQRLTIGAAETHSSIASSQIVLAEIPALAHLAKSIGDAQVRNRGTIGGALVSNFLHTDYAAALFALDCHIHTTSRVLKPRDFVPQEEAPVLARDELIVSVSFEIPNSAVYVRLEHAAGGYAELGVFCTKDRNKAIAISLIGAQFEPAQLPPTSSLDLSDAVDTLQRSANLSAYHAARLRRLLQQASTAF